MHTQSYLKMAEEVEKEHKKMVDKVSLQADEMKASYKKLVTEVQSSSFRGTAATEQRRLSISILLHFYLLNFTALLSSHLSI
uniref:Uncharacterized protein n=1 Tax=Hordeum vulgare subsp. vulgare TaxID=112509 RepID=A0A8I6XVS7_HORVV